MNLNLTQSINKILFLVLTNRTLSIQKKNQDLFYLTGFYLNRISSFLQNTSKNSRKFMGNEPIFLNFLVNT